MSEEQILEILVDFANAVEAAAVNVKHRIGELTGVKGAIAVKEETISILKFEKQQGERIGEFEVAYVKNNIPEKFQQALNILNKANATISDRYHGPRYSYSYWLYGEGKIYRQKLKRN